MEGDDDRTRGNSSGRSARIALIGPVPPPYAGMSAQVMRWARNLQVEGHEVRVVSTRCDLAGRPARRAAAFLIDLLAAIQWARIVNVHTGSHRSFHAFATPSVLFGRLLGRRVLVTYKGGEALPFLTSSRLARSILKFAGAVLVPSGYLRSVMARFDIQAHIVPNILEPPGQRPAGRRDEAFPTLIVTRNLEPLYSVGIALRAFARVRLQFPGARLEVYGDGSERAGLESYCRSERLENVTFHGNVPPEEIQEALLHATLFLNPSTVDNTPNSLLEALNAGTPVVTSDVGGIEYLVQHRESALLVPPRDDQKMAEAALTILLDPGLADRLIRRGREIASSFLWSSVYASYRSVIEVFRS